MHSANFDAVVIRQDDASERSLTVEEFAAIAITERVRLVSGGMVKFFRNGQTIKATEAFRKTDTAVDSSRSSAR